MVLSTISTGCSNSLKKKHPHKMKDPGSFTIPCSIRSVKIGKALLDLGPSINLMPLSMLKKIDGLALKLTKISFIMADGSSKKPYGVVEDVVIRIERLEFLVDFVVIEMKEDDKILVILGRSFMKMARVIINVYDGVIMLKDREEKVKEEEKVDKGGTIHFDLKDATFKPGTPVRYKKKL
ncbi:uncharacterized protein LOC106753516 [Vigna radiata var. radiata]|uniref:Uncharacterized protein LOC106753516 n=1 Tax=Vigna radiata var. radiata TaxID=3916 RepID=A0A1S3TAN1_VIGRR|nr:uncharacterized protein LOC106753516 [Vigna radiata var. radiata]